MATRIPVEKFNFPVDKIKAGYYSDAYFMRAREILTGDNHHPRVLMQIFPRADVVVCGIDETIALLKQCAFNPEKLVIHALHDGDEVKEWETIMTIEGDYADFAHLKPFIQVFQLVKAALQLMFARQLRLLMANLYSSSLLVMIFIKLKNPMAMQL